MSADYDIVSSASKALYQLIAYGDFKVKLAVVDQMLYILKELMRDSPLDFLVTQFFQ